MEHCKDHERQGSCIIRIDQILKGFRDDWSNGRTQMQKETEKIWTAMDSKLSAKAFAWIVGILVMIMMATIGTQWAMLYNINEKVNMIAVKQGKILGTLGVHMEDNGK